MINIDELTKSQVQYLSDEMYLPIEYQILKIKPFYSGNGKHSVLKLEEICRKFEQYCIQQEIIKNNCMKHIVELKYNMLIK